MTLLICLPLILVVVGLLARGWFIASRQDIRSIESHRSNLHHLEHLTPQEGSGSPAGSATGSAHVRIVGQRVDRAQPAVRPMVWGRPDGRTPAARPAWHSSRPEPVRARYAQARRDAEEHAGEERPRIVITDDAFAATSGHPSGAAPETATTAASRAASAAASPATSAGAVLAARRRRSEEADAATVANLGGAEKADAATVANLGGAEDPPPVVITDPEVADLPGGAAPAPAHRRPRRVGSGHRRAVRVLASAAGLMVVAAGAGLAVEELQQGGSGQTTHRASASAPAPAPAASPTTSAPAPPPTTPPALTATRTSATEAFYTLPAGPLQVSLSTSSACWVELRSGSPSGPISYEGTLQAGATQSFGSSGGMWLRLGDPSGVQLRINGSPVTLPGDATPFNVTVTTA